MELALSVRSVAFATSFGPSHGALGRVRQKIAPSSSGSVHACRMHATTRHEYAVPDLLAESKVPGSARLRWTYWPRWNESRDCFEELVTEENREWPTFLDFEYAERRAMQCIALFCDVREDLLRCLLLVLVSCRLFPWSLRVGCRLFSRLEVS